MIISHQHRFIFLKTRKTAGTSIDIALSGRCGPNDVITRLNTRDDRLRRELGYPSPQNYYVPVRYWTARDTAKFLIKRRRPRYTEHMSASSISKRIDQKVWDSYFKFCVERNPYDKAVSLYYWRTRRSSDRPSLEEFLRTVDRRSLSNLHIYSIDGKVVADRVLRYEELTEELRSVSASLGIGPLNLPRAKGGFRRDNGHYREIVTKEARALIEEACAHEIDLLGYRF